MEPLTLGLIFTIINIAVLINAHGRKVWVPRVGDWDSAPPVLVSTSARCSVEQVQIAVDYWRSLGHELQDATATDTAVGPVPGCIFVGVAGQRWKDGLAGRATWKTVWPDIDEDADSTELPAEDYHSKAEDIIELGDLGTITQAVIELDPLLPKGDFERVLLHEFGHALGYLHTETAMLGRRKKDRKNGKRKAGEARRFLGIAPVYRKKGHVMHPLLSEMGNPYKKANQGGLREDEDEN